jgi:A/G-specific adenine glycosylase
MPKSTLKKLRKNSDILNFQKKVLAWYLTHKRILPWRETSDPYKILVSEYMLQQTQVPRVIEKYLKWIQTFPTIRSVARAPLSKVLKYWSGLGYNRRAVALHRAAKIIEKEFNGKVPQEFQELISLPGIGHYTAHAILAFAYNKPVVMIETNIRTVFIDSFFARKKIKISDSSLLNLIELSIPDNSLCSAKDWYWALMDYGTLLKSQGNRQHTKSVHYSKQSKFKGSQREVRGAILKLLITKKRCTVALIKSMFPERSEVIPSIIQKLNHDGLIHINKNTITLP